MFGKKLIQYEPLTVYIHPYDQCPGRVIVVSNYCLDTVTFFNDSNFWLTKILEYYKSYMNDVFSCFNLEMHTSKQNNQVIFDVIPRHESAVIINGYTYVDPCETVYDPSKINNFMPQNEYEEYIIKTFIAWRYTSNGEDIVLGSSNLTDSPWVCNYIGF